MWHQDLLDFKINKAQKEVFKMGWFGNSKEKDIEKLNEKVDEKKKQEDKVITETKKDLEKLKKEIKK